MNTSASSALVLGLGVSGLAAARLLARDGFRVTALDESNTETLRRRADSLRSFGVQVQLGQDVFPADAFDRAVISPGIPPDHPWSLKAAKQCRECIGELEWGWRHRSSPVFAVTGTNGKSTVVKCLHEMLSSAGWFSRMGGNYGQPVSSLVYDGRQPSALVLEVSSFQLQRIVQFRPEIGVLLNIQPNHLDRHGHMEAYAAEKMKLFGRMQAGDTAIVPRPWADRVRSISPAAECRTFGSDAQADYRYRQGRVETPSNGSVDLVGSCFHNEVMGPAAAAIVAVADCAGLAVDALTEVFRVFEPPPHRMQYLGEVCGVRFVDNSKATSLSALSASLCMSHAPVRLIAGGRPKESDFSLPLSALKSRAAGVYLIGEAAEAMASSWSSDVMCRFCDRLEDAVDKAFADAEPGDTLLLSPGCASFDQFENYRQRGLIFAKCFKKLAKTVVT